MTVPQRILLAALPLFIINCTVARAESRCAETVATLVSVQGNVDVRGKDTEAWQPAKADAEVCAGDSVTVRRFSRAVLRVELEQTNVQLGEGTTLTLPGTRDQEFSVIELLKGITHFISRVPHALKIKTPFVNAAVEGTEFVVKVDDEQALVSVSEGHVLADNAAGKLLLQSGQSALTTRGTAPGVHTIADPMETVQWALYYPHVFEFETQDITNFGLEAWRSVVADSVRALRANDLSTALTLLEQAGNDGITSNHYLLYRAHLLLMVGRVAEAQADIEQVLAADPSSSVAWVMRSVIAVTQGRAQFALESAQKAVQADANSAAAYLALSYAYQARFDLDSALTAALTATKKNEDSALAWARVAELQLMHGHLDNALLSAQLAERINPNSAQAKTVLGFAYLMELQSKAAATAFYAAAHLDPAAPLPRLGLGLVKIRQGDLDGGRAQLEIATSLDPRASSLRSYVGKAYYEEHRDALAAQQFNYAKELDPNDPTPWFYNAFLLQTQGKPGEALSELQKSIELNDNRAVYRSRLLLESDAAARTTSVARIYRELGFDDEARSLAAQSITTDPTNAGGHRFLAESYLGQERYEIARASEFLQYMLLRPLSAAPLPPRMSEANLAVPNSDMGFAAGLNEYTNLFARNGVRFIADLSAGNDATTGSNLVASATGFNTMLSVGHSYYKTDGFRENANIRHNLYNVFLQSDVTPTFSAQLEYRKRDSTQGDLRQNIDADNYYKKLTQDLEQSSARLGAHWMPTPNQDLIFSVIRYDKTIGSDFSNPNFMVDVSNRDAEKGVDIQAQYLLRLETASVITGIGRYLARVTSRQSIFGDFGNGPEQLVLPERKYRSDAHNIYAYGNFALSPAWLVTAGLASDSLKDSVLNIDKVNPKLGLRINLTPDAQLRLASFQTTKRIYPTNQILEPTQIAGFNQFFDDANGAQAKVAGLGFDWSPSKSLVAGAEVSTRKVSIPFPDYSGQLPLFNTDQSELSRRLYVHWLPMLSLSASAALDMQRIANDESFHPLVRTQALPLSAAYFFTTGLSISARATYIKQYVAIFNETDASRYFDKQTFSVLDAAAAYHFAHRRGGLSLEVNNVFDRPVHYQSLSGFNADVFDTAPHYLPHRTLLVRAAVNF